MNEKIVQYPILYQLIEFVGLAIFSWIFVTTIYDAKSILENNSESGVFNWVLIVIRILICVKYAYSWLRRPWSHNLKRF